MKIEKNRGEGGEVWLRGEGVLMNAEGSKVPSNSKKIFSELVTKCMKQTEI